MWFFIKRKSNVSVTDTINCSFESNWAMNLRNNLNGNGDDDADDELLGVDLSKVSGNGGAIAVHMTAGTQPSLNNIKITNNTFANNTAQTYGGTLYFGPSVQGELSSNTFKNVFIDNKDAIRPHVGDLGEFRGSLLLIDNVINVMTAKSAVAVISYRASDMESFMESDNLELFCPVGFKSQTVATYVVLSDKRKPIETLMIYCLPCNENLYSLIQPHLLINNITVVQINESECLTCPYGAECNINVHAKANFWGISVNDTVTMYLCPEEYCCQNLTCDTYDVCSPNRVGIMCGQCDQGYSESLFSAKCISNDNCTYAFTFWLVVVVYGVLYVTFFILEEEFEVMVRKWINWLRFVLLSGILEKINKCLKFSSHRRVSAYADDDRAVGAYLSIFMYYVQVPSILKVSILYRDRSRETPLNYILDTVKNIFSFNTFGIHLKTCIFEGITAIIKIWIKLAFVMYLFGILLVLYVLVRMFIKSVQPQRDDSFQTKSALINAKFVGAFVSLLMYTYQYFAENTMVMLKCIDITSTEESVLFIDANVICYQPWQYAVIIFLCVYVIPFACVLAVAPDLLRRDIIGIELFIVSLFIPLFSSPFLIARFIKYRVTKEDNKVNAIKNIGPHTQQKNARYLVSRLLADPYRNTFAWGICWEGVIAFRRLLLVVIATFTPSLLLRHILLGLGCQMSLLMQLLVRPFVKRSCNVLETLSLSILLLVSMMNLLKAAYFQSGEIPESTPDKVFEVYDWVEAIFFAIIPLGIVCVLVTGVFLRMLAIPLGLRMCQKKITNDAFKTKQESISAFGEFTKGPRHFYGTRLVKTSLYQKPVMTNDGAITTIMQRYNTRSDSNPSHLTNSSYSGITNTRNVKSQVRKMRMADRQLRAPLERYSTSLPNGTVDVQAHDTRHSV